MKSFLSNPAAVLLLIIVFLSLAVYGIGQIEIQKKQPSIAPREVRIVGGEEIEEACLALGGSYKGARTEYREERGQFITTLKGPECSVGGKEYTRKGNTWVE